MKIIKSFFIFFLFIFWATDVLALEKPTHKAINETVANISNVNNYLINELKFADGIRTFFNNKRAVEWMQDGGVLEDEPMYTRSLNHFLDPLTNTGYLGTFKTAREWAQDQGAIGSLFGGNYSWKSVREYYYIALTGRDFNGLDVATDKNRAGEIFRLHFSGPRPINSSCRGHVGSLSHAERRACIL